MKTFFFKFLSKKNFHVFYSGSARLDVQKNIIFLEMSFESVSS